VLPVAIVVVCAGTFRSGKTPTPSSCVPGRRMRTTRRRRGGSTGGVGVGRRCAAGDGLRDTSPVVYGGVDVQACSEERLLLAAGEARRSGGDLGPRRPQKRRFRPPRRPRRRPWRAPPVQKKKRPRCVLMGITR
jgi:hypothetical protein